MVWLSRKQLERITNYAWDNRTKVLVGERVKSEDVIVINPITKERFVIDEKGKTVAIKELSQR